MTTSFPAATLSAISAKTVPSDYCWDNGVPVYEQLVDATAVTTNGVTTYTGYAPYLVASVASDIVPGFITLDNLSAARIINFGDYYNLSSVKTELGSDGTLSEDYITDSYERVGFCHTYLMPGKYHISVDSYSFISKPRIKIADVNQVHVEANQPSTEFTILEYLPALTSYDVKDSNNNIVNTIYGVPLKRRPTGEIYAALTRDVNPFVYTSEKSNIATVTKTDVFSNIVYEVREIPPTAAVNLVTFLPSTKMFPVSAEFTAKYTKCGSFPIEKIVWDMGDGSPLLEQSRHAINTDINSEFKENGDTTSFAINDPRFFNVHHVFKARPDKKINFTVSLTAYAANTNTFSIASLQFDSLQFPVFNPTNFKILQTEFTDTGKIYLGEVENTTAVWYADK